MSSATRCSHTSSIVQISSIVQRTGMPHEITGLGDVVRDSCEARAPEREEPLVE
jgi:hypothetical protein